jgi:hypothetical protein
VAAGCQSLVVVTHQRLVEVQENQKEEQNQLVLLLLVGAVVLHLQVGEMLLLQDWGLTLVY